MDIKTSTRHRRWTPGALLFVLLLVVVLPASAAYRVQRPITYDGGRLNQSYLYGEVFGTSTHKGVDLSYGLGTDVYAIADGTVVDLEENITNETGSSFGNFVLIRHSARHWDRTTQQWAYVYSIYAHLSEDSVRYSEGDSVTAGTWIAEVDDTGWSSGHHLHLQICIHPESDRTLVPNTLNSENTSRNPELWLQAFNYDGTNTGTVVGKVTDSNGQPIGDRYVWGLSKPPGSGSGGTTYLWSRTYAYDWTNPDDILVENWGTTDVLPGLYHLYVKNESGTYTYADLGWHTVEAGKTTYVGLYPIYLPDIMENYEGWNSSIVIRNNSDSETAQVNTTFFRYDGAWVHGQKTDYLPPKSLVTVDFPGYCYYCRGSAIVSASQDVSVVVKTVYDSAGRYLVAAYPGETSPATTVYAPYVVRNWFSGNANWRQTSDLVIRNAGNTQANVTVTFYDAWGSYGNTGQVTRVIPLQGQVVVPGTDIPVWEPNWNAGLGSAMIASDQPVAVVVNTYIGTTSGNGAPNTPYLLGNYRAFTSGANKVYVPLTASEYYGYDSSIQVQNASAGTTTFRIKYYDMTQEAAVYTTPTYVLTAYRAMNFWRPPGLSNYLGSAVVEVVSGGPVVAFAQYDRYNANTSRYGVNQYEGVTGATQMNVLAYLLKDGTWTHTGIQAQNMQESNTSIRLHYYSGGGNEVNPPSPFKFAYPGHAVNYWGAEIVNVTGSAIAETTTGANVALMINVERADSGWVDRDGMFGYGATR